jgi:hypothetical protein
MIETNAILAISSLDRYTSNNTPFFGSFGSPATTNYSLIASYNNSSPPSNDFQITTPGVLTYGYISKIVVTQIQLQYNIPTVNSNLNNLLPFVLVQRNPFVLTYFEIFIPSGFYTPSELAAMLEQQMNLFPLLDTYGFLVTYDQVKNEFKFTTEQGIVDFFFPDIDQIIDRFINLNQDLSEANLDTYLRTYKLLGLAIPNATAEPIQVSYKAPDFLYTPYIDIYSNALTAYQKLSDGNSTVSRPKGLVSRVYLSGVGAPQITKSNQALGDSPFVVTLDLNNPKVIRWTKDVAINSLDFQMRDCYGDLIPGRTLGSNTEFQMTLLCIEGEQD